MPTRAVGHTRPRAIHSSTRAARSRSAFSRLVPVAQRTLVIGLALGVLALFIAGTIEQRWKEAQVRDQVVAQQAGLRAAQARHDQLQSRLQSADPEAYRAWVEQTARRQLNLGYPGETIYLVNWTGAAVPAPPAPAPTPVTRTTAARSPWQRMLEWLGR